ncbi:hypothetical protein CFN78_00185 [Amycolatopsis antarctica]|uniref:Uncharacterized protein n=1 Tax=Amycolatopsis antarctica TaxID=1854586 RepID=A0A263DB34_9PSEU|nr:hypothetical protein [Amycolatopsis antarctica]OZM74706.1 hypothetical protein CFN78_00185 [Amycolatopsis antarctica]
MPTHKKLYFAALALVVLGVVSILLQPSGPDTECAPPGGPTSGYFDQEKGCAVTMESMDEVGDYYSSPKLFRIAGVFLVVVGIGTGIGGVVAMGKSRRKNATHTDGTPMRT